MPLRAPARRRASHTTGLWFVAVAFAVLMAFGTAPTPLWPLYKARDHFGATTVTVAYVPMVVIAAAAFLGMGHLSDRLGRRRIIAPALLVGIVASVVTDRVAGPAGADRGQDPERCRTGVDGLDRDDIPARPPP
ncbi:hypothetical protein [Streptomyces sp. NPDC047990]|uniref:hypothetical protein n=1 Tax=Streptomyces sp. NPDC047990 TaxID=3365496 RepID=UPI003710A294